MMEDSGEDWEWECNETSGTREAKLNGGLEEERIEILKYYAYGVAMPIVCCLGILGNSLNLLVLTRSNMKAHSYNYMRGLLSSLLVRNIEFPIHGADEFPFSLDQLMRVLPWQPFFSSSSFAFESWNTGKWVPGKASQSPSSTSTSNSTSATPYWVRLHLSSTY